MGLYLILPFMNACAAPTAPMNKAGSSGFHAQSHVDLHTSMRAMARQISVIARMDMDDPIPPEQQREQVLPLLEQIEVFATELDNSNFTARYPVVNRYMSAFIDDVGVARQFVNRTPPNLVPAKRLILSCLSCHDST